MWAQKQEKKLSGGVAFDISSNNPRSEKLENKKKKVRFEKEWGIKIGDEFISLHQLEVSLQNKRENLKKLVQVSKSKRRLTREFLNEDEEDTFELEISRLTLKSAETLTYKVCKGVRAILSRNVCAELSNIDIGYLSLIIENVKLESDGVNLAQNIDAFDAIVFASFAVIKTIDENVLAQFCLEKDFLLDLIGLIKGISTMDIVSIILIVEAFVRRYKIDKLVDFDFIKDLLSGVSEYVPKTTRTRIPDDEWKIKMFRYRQLRRLRVALGGDSDYEDEDHLNAVETDERRQHPEDWSDEYNPTDPNNEHGELWFRENRAQVDSESKFMNISHYMLEVIGIAALSKMLGMTDTMSDFKQIKPFLTSNITKIATNIVDYLVAVVKVIFSGDFNDFLLKVGSLVNKGRKEDLALMADQVMDLENDKVPHFGMESHRTKLDVVMTKITHFIEESIAFDHNMDVISFKALFRRCQQVQIKIGVRKLLTQPRKEPLFLFGMLEPGVGKSLIPIFVANGVARALGIDGKDAFLLNYFWSMSEEFQEGYSAATRMIVMDDIWAVKPEHDPDAGKLAQQILSIVSPNPMQIPKAYEGGKGMLTTANLMCVIANSNTETATLKKLYTKDAENFIRRAQFFEIEMSPKMMGKTGRIDLAQHAGSLTPKFMDENIIIKLFTYRPKDKPGDNFDKRIKKQFVEQEAERIDLFSGGPTAFSTYIYEEMMARLSGKFAKVNTQLLDFLSWKPELKSENNLAQFSSRDIIDHTRRNDNYETLFKLFLLSIGIYSHLFGIFCGFIAMFLYALHISDFLKVFLLHNCPKLLYSLSMTLYSFWIADSIDYSYKYVRNSVQNLEFRFRSVWERVQVFLKSRKFAELALCAGATMLIGKGIIYTMQKKPKQMLGTASFGTVAEHDFKLGKRKIFHKESNDELYENSFVSPETMYGADNIRYEYENNQAQVLKMPISEDEKLNLELPTVTKEFLHGLVKIAHFDKTQGVIRPVMPSGQGMNYTVLNKLRNNYMCVTIVEIDGKKMEDINRVLMSCYGFRMNGTTVTVAHGVPYKWDKMIFELSWPFMPGAEQRNEVVQHDVSINREFDIMLLPSIFPSNVRDVCPTIYSENPKPRIGTRVLLLGLNPDLDQKGTVVYLGPIGYMSSLGTHKLSLGVEVQWDNGWRSSNGDCNRILLEVIGNSYNFIGRLVYGNPENGLSGIASSPEGSIRNFVEKNVKNVSLAQCSMWDIPDVTICIEGPQMEYVNIAPTSGVFAYEHIRDKIIGNVVGTVQGVPPPPGSQLLPSPYGSIVRTELDKIGKRYAPAVLMNTVRYDTDLQHNRIVSPYEMSLTNEKVNGTFKIGVAKEYLEGMSNYLSKFVLPAKVLNVNDALLAFDDYKPVNMKTAASETESGKKGMFVLEYQPNDGDMYRFLDPRMNTACIDLMNRFAAGHIVPGFAKTSLKDEMLSTDKVEACRTRIFEAQCFRSYLVMRAILGKCFTLLKNALKKLGSCVGINASSKDWKFVAERIFRANCKKWSLDFKFFDKKFQIFLHILNREVIARFVVACLEKQYGNVMNWNVFIRCLLWNTIMMNRLIDSAIIFGYAGNCSGKFDTVQDNDFENIILWFFLMKNIYPEMTFENFVNTFLAGFNCFGDDVTLSTSLELVDLTALRIASEMYKFGQIITGGGVEKTNELDSEVSITFLKRGFYLYKGDDGVERWFAPLEITSILKSLLCYMPSGSERDDMLRHVAVLKTAWEESFLHNETDKKVIRMIILACIPKLPSEYQQIKFVSDEELLVRWDAGLFKVWEM